MPPGLTLRRCERPFAERRLTGRRAAPRSHPPGKPRPGGCVRPGRRCWAMTGRWSDEKPTQRAANTFYLPYHHRCCSGLALERWACVATPPCPGVPGPPRRRTVDPPSTIRRRGPRPSSTPCRRLPNALPTQHGVTPSGECRPIGAGRTVYQDASGDAPIPRGSARRVEFVGPPAVDQRSTLRSTQGLPERLIVMSASSRSCSTRSVATEPTRWDSACSSSWALTFSYGGIACCCPPCWPICACCSLACR